MEPGGAGGRNPAAGTRSNDNPAVVVQIQTPHHPISPASPQFASSFPPTPPHNPHRVPHSSTFPISPAIRLRQSEFSKPKSRLVEPPPPYSTAAILKQAKAGGGGGSGSSPYRKSPYADVNMPTKSPEATPITPRTPLIGSPGEDDADDGICKTTNVVEVRSSTSPGKKKWKVIASIELAAFVSIVALLTASLTIPRMNNSQIWGLRLWKWFVLLLVIFCGRLATEYTVNVLVFLIERNFLLKKKVLYFIYGLKDCVQAFIWIGLVLLAWVLLFHLGVDRSPDTTKILSRITRAISGVLIAAAVWLLKTVVIKLLASSYHVNRFFDRIQESIFHQYVLRALSGPPVMEMAESIGRGVGTPGRLSFRSIDKDKDQQKEEVIDMDKLKKLKHEKVSAWTMKGLVDVVLGSGLSTLSSILEFTEETEEEYEQKDYEITSEWEAKAAAYKVFRNVTKTGSKYIDEEDLLRFLKKEEVDNFILLFDGASGTGKIKRSVFKKWLVKVYKERKSLAHSLNDTKTAIEELNKLVSVILILVSIVVWLLVMGFLSTQVLVFISSQFLLAAFMFGNTAKTVFEAIVFVFVMHPFDVGDRCVVDGIQMTVEEMNLLTTVFLRYDNEKIFYPNSVLAAKPISNFYRSPQMSDAVEFSVDVSTSMDDIGAVKGRIKAFLESKPQYWRPDHSVLVKGIEDMNKMHMGLYVNHTMNFQNGERGNRISDLVVEMKKIFEDIGIKYHLPTQEVHVRYVEGSSGAFPPPR
ncbi:Mechanosensitive ion channel protein 10 [Linum grandiflorum]